MKAYTVNCCAVLAYYIQPLLLKWDWGKGQSFSSFEKLSFLNYFQNFAFVFRLVHSHSKQDWDLTRILVPENFISPHWVDLNQCSIVASLPAMAYRSHHMVHCKERKSWTNLNQTWDTRCILGASCHFTKYGPSCKSRADTTSDTKIEIIKKCPKLLGIYGRHQMAQRKKGAMKGGGGGLLGSAEFNDMHVRSHLSYTDK